MNNKLNILLVTGIVTDEHDPRMIPMLKLALEATGRFNVKITEAFKGATAETLEDFDLVFLDYDGKKDVATDYVGFGERTERVLYEFVKNGGGAVVYHSSFIHSDQALPEEFDRLVGCHFSMLEGGRKSPRLTGPVTFCEGAHEIVEGFPIDFVVQQEDFFFNPTWLPDVPVTVLATSYDDVQDYTDPRRIQAHRLADFEKNNPADFEGINTEQPVAWVHEYGKGRVFTVSIGHGPDTLRCAPFVALLVRATEWAASGEVTIPYPNLDNENRTRCWPYYLNMSITEFARYSSF